MGFAFALDRSAGALHGLDVLQVMVVLVGASVSLVAHIIVFNDWAGIDGDLKDPSRSARTFLSLGVSRRAMCSLALLLAALGLAASACLGEPALWIATGMLVTSALYSAPRWHLKGAPVASSLLHLLGGGLHCLLGYVAIARLNVPAVLFAGYFGVVFAAGHLMHEVRGHDADCANGIRTNAVAFGKKATFIAAFVLFNIAYLLLAVGSAAEQLWGLLVMSVVAYWLHIANSWRALQSQLELYSLLRLQSQYRLSFMLIGIALLVTFTLPYMRTLLSGAAG